MYCSGISCNIPAQRCSPYDTIECNIAFQGANRSAVHLGGSESGLEKGERCSGSTDGQSWAAVSDSLGYASRLRPWFIPTCMTSPIFPFPPRTLRSEASRMPPRRPAGRRRILGPSSMLGQGFVANESGHARRTTWLSKIPGLIEFDYRCRSFIAAHFHNTRNI